MEAYKRGSHTVWDCKYHLVWSTKYRFAVLGAMSGSGAASFYLPVGDRQVLFAVDGWNGKGLSGLQSVGGNDEPIPARS